MTVGLKRVYEPPSQADGTRILVDRLWPRGLSKDKAQVDLWLKEVALTTGLRRWFNHDPEKWPEFQRRYRAELLANGEAVSELKAALASGRATLVYGAIIAIPTATPATCGRTSRKTGRPMKPFLVPLTARARVAAAVGDERRAAAQARPSPIIVTAATA